ncbi:HipA N-terminal domain-containing protein [Rhizosphaericola mali]|uniref:Phosphatidylinositol kinase n=1 Tax=Rhizosphaericola mali TaxID=2545455 RepID=A0A5P2G997_9BACT|nr:HipA N-terminal domain-containing protein [Rhizosphaericola mali]QES90290.1 phosphatidylinositol kinase [Rhizosphaericola mali]
MRQGKVFNNQIYVGLITQLDDGSFKFEYDDVYFTSENYSAISLTLPKNTRVYFSPVLFPFFFNMLSEGRNKLAQSRILKIDENDHFTFLIKTASTESIGAIRVEEV